jgi:hypothetical protein
MELRTRTHTIEEIEQHKPQYLKPEAPPDVCRRDLFLFMLFVVVIV